jgi:hypothetical protein
VAQAFEVNIAGAFAAWGAPSFFLQQINTQESRNAHDAEIHQIKSL